MSDINDWQLYEARKQLALLDARLVAANIEMNAMLVANREREMNGLALAYGEADFMELVEKYHIYQNQIVGDLP